MNRLGELLTAASHITPAQCTRALAIARNTRSRLGEVLISEGSIRIQQLYQTLAQQHGLPFVDLLVAPPDPNLLDGAQAELYLQLSTLPYQRKDGRLIFATSEYTPALRDWAHACYGTEVDFVMTSPVDIHKTVQALLSGALMHKSVLGLFESDPDLSAHTRKEAKKWWFGAVLLGLLLAICYAPTHPALLALMGICHLLYAVAMLFKVVVYGAGMAPHRFPEQPAQSLGNADLPVYTILIPMYREIESLPNMLRSMRMLDYPPAKLDIKLVFEADDHAMIEAARRLRPQYHFEIIQVPPSQPRTKPKACNYALRFAKGSFVTVYDADDRPDPGQLKKALQAFAQAPPEVVCVQARLNYYNTHDNWLTRLFSLEYAMLFHTLLPGLARLRMPIMLGGTSNHFSINHLRALGEWDPFNVTEDADLGTRLAARGYHTWLIDSDTMEEAPNTVTAWIKQRTRWIKGYMQTWLVHMRHPVRLWHALGPRGFMGFQCFVALSSFSYLSAPLAWGIAILGWTQHVGLPPWLYILALANLAANLLVHSATALHATFLYDQRRLSMMIAGLLYPFYLILHSIASYVALWQLLVKPYSWNKTAHGRARTDTNFQLTRKRRTD